MTEKHSKLPKVSYSPEEEDWLCKNALLFRDIIENKRTDGVTKREKDKAWEEISNAFNLAPPFQMRTMKSLREKYTKIKQTLKNRVFFHAQDAKKTGGGPPKKELPPLSESKQELLSILMPSTVGLSPVIGDSDFESTRLSVLQDRHDDNEAHDASSQSIDLILNEELSFLNEECNIHNIEKDINNTAVANKQDENKIEGKISNTNKTDYAWDIVNPAKLRKPRNPLLQNRFNRQKVEHEIPNKVIKLTEGMQQLKERKQEIEIEILEGEKERYILERKRAALDVERAEIEREKAELDRERSAVELQRSKNQLQFEKDMQKVRLATVHKRTHFDEHPAEIAEPTFLTAAARKEYLN